MPSRQLLVIELVIVLALTLGRSGIYALVRFIGAATAPGGLSAQTTTMHGSYAPAQPWLDLTLQLLGIVFAVVPVALAGYLLVRSGTACGACGSGGPVSVTWAAAPRSPRRSAPSASRSTW